MADDSASYVATNATNVTLHIPTDNYSDSVPNYDNNYTDEAIFESILDYIQPKVYNWIFLILFSVVFFVGITGNFLVCYSVWRCKQLKTVTNYFLVNLAAADFLVILICLPASVISETMRSWFVGEEMCKVTIYLQKVSVFVSVLTLTSISVERYLVICHPLTYHGESFKTKLGIILIWVTALITPCFDLHNVILQHDSQVPASLHPWMSTCQMRDGQTEQNLQLFFVVAFYFLPLVIMAYAYTKIAMCLWSSMSTGMAVSENLQYESAMEQLRMRRRTAKMLIVVVIAFGLCYLPIYTLNIAMYTHALNGLGEVTSVCLWWTARFLCYFNSALNPVIYNFMSGKFRKQFKTACYGCYSSLRCCFKKRKERSELHNCSQFSKSYHSRTTNIRMTLVARNTSNIN